MLVVRKGALRRSAVKGLSVYPISSAYCRLEGAGNIGHRCFIYLYSFIPLHRYLKRVASSHNTFHISVLICNKKAYCFVRIIRALEALSYNSHQSCPSVSLSMRKSFNNHVPLNSCPPGVPEDNHLLKIIFTKNILPTIQPSTNSQHSFTTTYLHSPCII